MSNQHLSGAKLTSFTLSEVTQAAEMLQASGQYQEAIDLYRQWLQHDRTHDHFLAWFNYGWLLQKLNKVEEATRAYDQVINSYANHLTITTTMHA
jgi:tetratricopeptide (TPR) repeat protein